MFFRLFVVFIVWVYNLWLYVRFVLVRSPTLDTVLPGASILHERILVLLNSIE
jgi:hypothetical protein